MSRRSYYDITCPAVPGSALESTRVMLDNQGLDIGEPGRIRYRRHINAPILVTDRAPLPLRRCVETLARYFQRDGSYDFVNYDARSRDPDVEAWLWTTTEVPTDRAVGYVCFYRALYEGREAREWALTTVWLHPYFRRCGALSALWPALQRRYGDFWIDPRGLMTCAGFSGLHRTASMTARRQSAGWSGPSSDPSISRLTPCTPWTPCALRVVVWRDGGVLPHR